MNTAEIFAAVCENILTLMWRILAAGPIQASSAALQLAAPQVRRWPSLYRLQNAMLELSTWSYVENIFYIILYLEL